jgi:hypothetical protein
VVGVAISCLRCARAGDSCFKKTAFIIMAALLAHD